MLIWNQLPHQEALQVVVKVHQVENDSFLHNKIDNE